MTVSRAQRICIAGTALGAGVALALAFLGPAPYGAALVFAIAALVAADTRTGVALGVLAVFAGLAVAPDASSALGAAGPVVPVLCGLALGSVARAGDGAIARLLAAGGVGVGVGACVLIALSAWLPDTAARLADADGAPMVLTALMADAETGMNVISALPATAAPLSPGVTALGCWALLLTGLAAFGLLAWRASGRDDWGRYAWGFVLVTVGLVVILAALGVLNGLLGTWVPLASPEALRLELSLGPASHPSIVQLLAVPEHGRLAPWSRPMIDGLRLVVAGPLLIVAWRAFRGDRRAAPAPSAPGSVLHARGAWLPLGAALAVVAAAVSARPSLALALGAGCALALGALISGRLSARAARAPAWLVVLAGGAWVIAWCLPLWAWTGA